MSAPLVATSFESLRIRVVDDDRAVLGLVDALLLTAHVHGSVALPSPERP